MDLATLTLELEQNVDIARPMAAVFEGLIQQFTEGMKYPDGRSMNFKMETRPGGRWYRDLGDDTGHLWGFVQVIKPPSLLEIYGPMFMSYPAANHLEVRLSEVDGKTRVSLRHRAIGMIGEQHRKGVGEGWKQMLTEVKRVAES